MKVKLIYFVKILLPVILLSTSIICASKPKSIQLLKPQMDKGRPLMQVLKDRKSSRNFSSNNLSLQVLSDLLWAAYGINRKESGYRTAPSAMNFQEIDIYVATADGLYIYDFNTHVLNQVFGEDIRALTGTQGYVKNAPVNLIYVADFSKITRLSDNDKLFYSAADTGFISENVYLYCASEGLATVVRGLIDRPALEKKMKLRTSQKVILAQSVGYPGK